VRLVARPPSLTDRVKPNERTSDRGNAGNTADRTVEVRQVGRPRPEFRGAVQAFVGRTVQTVIVEDRGELIGVRDMTEVAFLPVPRPLRRMLELDLDLQQRAGEAWTKPTLTPSSDWERWDNEVDRYTWLVERRLRRHVEEGSADTEETGGDPLAALLVARSLERIGDHAVRLGFHGARPSQLAVPSTLLKLLTDHHGQILEDLRDACGVYERPDSDRANRTVDTAEALRSDSLTLRERFLSNQGPVPTLAATSLTLALEPMERTGAYAADIAEVGLDRAGGGGPLDSLPPPIPGHRKKWTYGGKSKKNERIAE
jgi:phosphate uptake regulator